MISRAEQLLRCGRCLFCEEIKAEAVVCTNPDVAADMGWEGLYQMQGYLELALPEAADEPCFWFVPRK